MSVRDVFTSACCHNECNNDKHRYKFNQNKLFPESYIIKLESCKTLDQCFVKDGVYYKTKSNCAVQVTVPSKSIHNDDSCVRTILIIPPDTRVDFDTNRTGRAERAVCAENIILEEDTYYGSNFLMRNLSYIVERGIGAISTLDDNTYYQSHYYESLYPINKINDAGIRFICELY